MRYARIFSLNFPKKFISIRNQSKIEWALAWHTRYKEDEKQEQHLYVNNSNRTNKHYLVSRHIGINWMYFDPVWSTAQDRT